MPDIWVSKINPETIEDEYENGEFDKVMGQYKLKLNGLLQPLRLYGQGVFVDHVVEQLMSLGFQLHLRLSGVDIPYQIEEVPW